MSKWREIYKVHPAADVFPMMSDEELTKLGEDIKANGLKHPIIFQHTGKQDEFILLDGRNRLEAMERAGILDGYIDKHYRIGDPIAHIIGLNIHRRHLTKQQQAELIVAAHKAAASAASARKANMAKGKPRQVEEVSKGGRGKVNEVKAAAVATAKEHGISKSTVERSFAKAEGRIPEPQKIAGPKLKTKPKLETHVGIDAARRYYVEAFTKLDLAGREAEFQVLMAGLKAFIGKSPVQAENGPDEIGDIPACLDRRRRP